MAKQNEIIKNKNKDADENDEDVIIVKEINRISDGVHQGKITNVTREFRQDFDYLDITVTTLTEKNEPIDIKYGVPTNLSERSNLGKLLNKSGFKFRVKERISIYSIKEHLLNKELAFQTFTDENGFAKIMDETIKFI